MIRSKTERQAARERLNNKLEASSRRRANFYEALTRVQSDSAARAILALLAEIGRMEDEERHMRIALQHLDELDSLTGESE